MVALAAALGLTAAWIAPAGAFTATPNDPLVPDQWALNQIGAPQAWATSTGAGITIGIVDTGVDLTHQDLAGKVVGAATCLNTGGDANQCYTGRGAGQDDYGHGTFVAGEAAANTNNGIGIAGAAPSANLVVAKVLDSTGQGNPQDINAGIEWVVQHGAQVVNLSMGPSDISILGGDGQVLIPGLEYAWQNHAVPVVAAGNNNLGGLSVIGNSGYGNVDALVVGATGPRGEVAWYSSPLDGTKWAVLGPGGNSGSCQSNPADCVISTYWSPGQQDVYAFSQGTSMAAPMVSAVVALLLGMGQTPTQAINTVLATATPGAKCGCAGMVNAAAAVQSALSQGAHPAVASSGRPATVGHATQPAVIVAAKTTMHATSDQPHPTTPPAGVPRATVITPAVPQTSGTTTTTTTVTTPPASTSVPDRQAPSPAPALALGAPLSSSTHRTPVASWAALAALLVAATALLTVMRRQQL